MRALEFLKFNIFIHAHHTQLKNALKSFNITVHDEVPPCGTVVAIAGSYHNKIHKLQSAFHNVYILVKTLNIYLLCAYSALLVQCYPHVCLMMKGFLLFQSRALCVMWTLISFFYTCKITHFACMSWMYFSHGAWIFIKRPSISVFMAVQGLVRGALQYFGIFQTTQPAAVPLRLSHQAQLRLCAGLCGVSIEKTWNQPFYTRYGYWTWIKVS